MQVTLSRQLDVLDMAAYSLLQRDMRTLLDASYNRTLAPVHLARMKRVIEYRAMAALRNPSRVIEPTIRALTSGQDVRLILQ